MEAFQALQTYAEVSATLVGLIAVIVVLRGRTERTWTSAELFGAIHVLLPGLIATISALIALALLASYGDELIVWRISHGLFGVIHLVGPIMFWTQPPETRIIFSGRIVPFIGTVSMLAICANFSIAAGYQLEHAQIVYFIGLTWVILANIYTFGMMLMNSGQGDA
jgi:hypothetical protein